MVLPMIGATTKNTLTSSGSRPNRSALARMSSRYSFIPSRPLGMHSSMSAFLAAKSRPRGDAPAWQITGRPCGLRGVFSGPRTEKCLPRWWIGATFLWSA